METMTKPFAVAYAPYLERVRLMMQRYVLALETAGRPAVGGHAPEGGLGADDVAQRCLFGLEMPPRRQGAIVELDMRLQVP
ncbi:MAG: hypothetical protein AAFX99_11900, partial [Myxococcota bacterium]